jgi:hypothetical protein
MVVRNASSGPNITAGRMIIAFPNASRTANSPSPRFRIRRALRCGTVGQSSGSQPHGLQLRRPCQNAGSSGGCGMVELELRGKL